MNAILIAGFLAGLLPVYALTARRLRRRKARRAERQEYDRRAGEDIQKGIDQLGEMCAHSGDTPAMWLRYGNLLVLLPNSDPDERVTFSRN